MWSCEWCRIYPSSIIGQKKKEVKNESCTLFHLALQLLSILTTPWTGGGNSLATFVQNVGLNIWPSPIITLLTDILSRRNSSSWIYQLADCPDFVANWLSLLPEWPEQEVSSVSVALSFPFPFELDLWGDVQLDHLGGMRVGKKRTSVLMGTYVCMLFQAVCLLFGISAYHIKLCSKLELCPNSQTMETEV